MYFFSDSFFVFLIKFIYHFYTYKNILEINFKI